MKKLHAGIMEIAVVSLLGYRQHLIVPNVSWGWGLRHEADLIAVNQSGYATEIEIKISLPDLKADFKKKNGHHNAKIARLVYAIPEYMVEPAKQLIPVNCGIIEVIEIENGYEAHWVRQAKRVKYAKPVTDEDRIKLGNLAAMRIWSLKSRLYEFQNKK